MPLPKPPDDEKHERTERPSDGSTEIEHDPRSKTEIVEGEKPAARADAGPSHARPAPPAREAFSEIEQAPPRRPLAGPRRPARVTARPPAPPAAPQRIEPGAPPVSPDPSDAPRITQLTGGPPPHAIRAGTSLLLETDSLPILPASPGIPPTIDVPPPNPHEAPTAELVTGAPISPSRRKLIAGRYEVEKELGEGGMGAVYRVFDTVLKRSAALKMIHAHRRDARRERRFLHEAHAMARLQHPSCVQIYDVGLDRDGAPYLVMELVSGEPLVNVIERGELNPRRAALIVHEIAGALQFVHESGIIHRDVKPDNILVSADGRAKLADFGIAKDDEAHTRLTKPDAMIGTLSYMPPEQTGGPGEQVDARSDVYALGATLFETLTGRPPFLGEAKAVLAAILEEEPVSPAKINAAVPRDLGVICLKCLQKEKPRRYQTARALQEDLGRFLADEPISARVPSFLERTLAVVKRHRKVVFASFSAAVAVGSIAAGIEVSVVARARADAATGIADGTAAFAAKDFERAERSFAEAAKLDTPRAMEAQEKALRARAWKLASDADRAFALYVSEIEEIEKQAPVIEELSDETGALATPFAEDKDKQRLAALSQRTLELKASAERHLHAAELAMENALALFPERALAERLIAIEARVYELSTDVDPTTLEPLAERAEELAKRFECDSRLPRGTISVSSSPGGGLVRVYRYELDPELGVERPHAWSAREGREKGVAPPTPEDYYPLLAVGNDLGVTPVAPVSLPAGSYLVTIEREGCLLARLPVLVRRKTQQKLEARLYPSNVLGSLTGEFAYVPAGVGRFGTGLRKIATCGDVFIMKREVTFGDWEEFYKDTGEKPENRIALFMEKDGEITRNHPKAAVRGIGVQQAASFANWYAKRHWADLAPKWACSLPTATEFFRAVRGPLVRMFPWGDIYDASFCNCARFNGGEVFLPGLSSRQDRSPLDVADLAGSAAELTEEQDPNGLVGWFVGASDTDPKELCRLMLTKRKTFPDARGGNYFIGFRVAIRPR